MESRLVCQRVVRLLDADGRHCWMLETPEKPALPSLAVTPQGASQRSTWLGENVRGYGQSAADLGTAQATGLFNDCKAVGRKRLKVQSTPHGDMAPSLNPCLADECSGDPETKILSSSSVCILKGLCESGERAEG